MYNKTVGIYMPTHNRLELLKEALNSVINQTYQNFKLIIVNDGSSDGTRDYLNTLVDPRISVIHHKTPQGACTSRNKAIAALDTELVTGLDDDDVFLPHRLEQLLSVYNDKYSFVCSGYFWDYGAHKKALFKDDRVISLSDAFDLNQCSNQILVKRDRIIAVECFDPNIPALQDHDLWVRLIAKYGVAYRTGDASYIVNDDHSLERISSVKNKLNAIAMFEKKHDALMSDRNKANFEFYKAKIRGDDFGFFDFIKSTKFGLVGLKSRQYISQYFKTASKLRLSYLQTGKLGKDNLFQWFLNALMPLLATGGPGASRVILLSSCIFFLGAEESSSFSGDFFIVMLLNTAFCQCYGFFLLKPILVNNFKSISTQSVSGLIVSLSSLYLISVIGLVSEFIYSAILLIVLHFYYLYRYQNISLQNFKSLALSEVLISLLCLICPYVFYSFNIQMIAVPYFIYTLASILGLLTVLINRTSTKSNEIFKVPFKSIKNISISLTASVFAIFMLPASVKSIVEPEVVSIIALAISCISIMMLIPRTYANKIMKKLADKQLNIDQFENYLKVYSKLTIYSSIFGLIITIAYLYSLSFQPGLLFIFIPMCVAAILVFSQHGFISLTIMSLHGEEAKVAKLNLFVLLITAFLSILLLNLESADHLLYLVVIVACASFSFRNSLALKAVRTNLAVKKDFV